MSRTDDRMDALSKVSRPRRAILALVVLASLVPLGSFTRAEAACDPLIPAQVCALLPGAVQTPPVDQSYALGQTFVPSNPVVKSGRFLYLHNFDSVEHFWMFSNGSFKRLGPGEFGARSQQYHISLANGFVPGQSYRFYCSKHTSMEGELTVTS